MTIAEPLSSNFHDTHIKYIDVTSSNSMHVGKSMKIDNSKACNPSTTFETDFKDGMSHKVMNSRSSLGKTKSKENERKTISSRSILDHQNIDVRIL